MKAIIVKNVEQHAKKYICDIIGGGYKPHKWKYTENIDKASMFASVEDAEQFLALNGISEDHRIHKENKCHPCKKHII